MAFWTGRRRRGRGPDITEATRALTPGQAKIPERTGYPYGIPRGGLNETNSGLGEATQTDRRSQLEQLYESYLACPWAWACVQAIARTITAGGLFMDWDTDTGEGDQEAPDKPEGVLAVERLVKFTNDRQNIRQVMRNVVVDLLVFGDAFLEVTWWGSTPVALYNLDVPTTTPTSDEHGKITGYVQVTAQGQRAEFEPRDVIHISMDAPRSGVFGVSPTQAALLPITAWLFAAATLKEMFRKGLPATVHADFPAGVSKGDQELWVSQVMARNIGPRNIGRPWVTKGGATLKELQVGKVRDAIDALSQKRDEVLAAYGVPPAKAGVIESGNIGGGTGEEQDITYKIDVCQPIAELVLEAFNYAIVQQGFGVQDWQAKFRPVDYRSSKVVEEIRDTRIRNGTYTINKSRAEIGEPPVEGGDDAVIIDRQNLVLVKDLAAMSKATVEKQQGGAVAATALAGLPGGPGQGQDAQPGGQQDDAGPGQGDTQGDDQPPREAVSPVILARYRRRLAEALRSMPDVTEASGGSAADAVYRQLAGKFDPDTLQWVKDAAWSGPKKVPIGRVDTADRAEWTASKPAAKAKITRFRRKLRAKLAAGKQPKLIVLVQVPGRDKLIIADGHHHFVATEQEGLEYAWAYVGKVDEDHGEWDTMAASRQRSAA